MSSGDTVALEHFTAPTCKKCGAEAEIYIDDNGACGDPECCGEYEEYAVLICPSCKVRENLR